MNNRVNNQVSKAGWMGDSVFLPHRYLDALIRWRVQNIKLRLRSADWNKLAMVYRSVIELIGYCVTQRLLYAPVGQ